MEFNYTARAKNNQIQKGVIEAPSRREAIAALHGRDLVILELNETGGQSVFTRRIGAFDRVTTKEMVAFARQLSALFSAKIPLLESLRSLARQTENEYFANIIFDIANEIDSGSLFSKALAKYPKVFSDLFINMVRSGEASGGLDRSLGYLAEYLEKQYYLNSKIKGAFIYPLFIVGIGLFVGVLLMIFVVPLLTKTLLDANISLPLPTRILIGTSHFLAGWGGLITLIVILGSIFGFAYGVKKSPSWRHSWDAFKIKMPLFGKVLRGIYLARMTENLSILIQGGLPILQVLQISADVVGNTVYRDIINEAKENVRIGGSISSSFEKYREIPPMVVQMIATGEQTGTVDEILKKLSAFYSKEVDASTRTLSQLIEPVMIIILAVFVAFLVASILIPLYSMVNAIS